MSVYAKRQNLVMDFERHLFGLYNEVIEDRDRLGLRQEPLREDQLPSRPTPRLDVVFDSARSISPSHPEAMFKRLLNEELSLPGASRPLPIVSATGRAAVLSGLMHEGYPPCMHHFALQDKIEEILATKPLAGQLSFAALGINNQGALDYLAGGMAHVRPSLVRTRDLTAADIVFSDDTVISPTGKKAGLGIRLFLEKVVSAKAHHGSTTVELRARANTSYRAFNPKGPIAKRLFGRYGFTTIDHGIVATFGQEPHVERMHLIEVKEK